MEDMTSLPSNLSIFRPLDAPQNTSCVGCYDNQTAFGSWMADNPLNQPLVRAVFITSCVLVALLCICGNALVLVVYRNHPMDPRITFVFLSNLAAADLLVGIFCVIPFMYRALYMTWELPRILCRIYRFMHTASITVSMLLLQVIALERFIAINYPLQAKRLFTKTKIRFAQVMVWAIAGLYGTPIFFVYHVHVETADGVSHGYCLNAAKYDHVIKAYIMINFGMWYLLPLLIMGVLYCKIVLTLRRSQLTQQAMGIRHRCPSQMMEANAEPGADGSLAAGASQEGGGTYTRLAQGTKKVRKVKSTRMIVSRMKVWWWKKGSKYPKPSSIVKQGCCSQARRGSTKRQSFSEDTKVTEEEQHASQETTFTAKRSPMSRVPRKFTFRTKQAHNGKGTLECPEPESTSQGASGGGERPADEERATARRWSGQSSRRSSCSNPANSSRVGSVPRCRLTTQYSSRRRAIRLLVAIVCTFALLLLPMHTQRLLQLLEIRYGEFEERIYLEIVSHLSMYLNSAVNPILYTFVSQSFRRNLRALCSCRDTACSARGIAARRVPQPDIRVTRTL